MEKNIVIRPATLSDAEFIGENLRESDRIELSLCQQSSPEVAVITSYACSTWVRSVIVDSTPTLIYGVSPTCDPAAGLVWMVATDKIHEIAHEFIDGCKDQVKLMQDQFHRLFNQVHKGNTLSIEWLEWLGFYVDRTPAGPGGEFFNFWRERHDNRRARVQG